MDIPLNELIPALDINKNVDMAILPGTPMVPNKPAIVIWYRNPLLKNSGVFAALNLNLTPSLFYSSRQEDYRWRRPHYWQYCAIYLFFTFDER